MAARDTRVVLALVSVVCVIAVAGALLAQHRLGMQPCPWCILQRIQFLLIAAVAALGALFGPPLGGRIIPRLAAWLIVPVAASGAAAAWYQHFVAARSSSCNLTLADRIISGLQLDTAWPDIFEVRASCADAAAQLAGMPFEFWSLGLFVLLVATGLWCALRADGR
ncbi:MAG: disulfide bond formation protein B [Burkholderiales bacterium]|nr:disulfide bond formation protein B [Burkholderiales bacterium]